MATMVRGSRRTRRPEGIEERERDRARSVREICLVGTAPGEPGEPWGRGPDIVALQGREYRVVTTQQDIRGGYLHLETVERGGGTTDR
ncbi:MAG TPA: hypothetical protein VFT74_07185 [Isosphaeraceae bacterium]|nr:hypothetical protein [Isosphaeraceae bacterium]